MIDAAADDGIRTLTISRLAASNALTTAGLEALLAEFEAATEPVVVLTGAGTTFCAGADLDEVAGFDRAEAAAFADLGQRVARAVETYDGVVVAAVDGAARGGGVELALAADVRAATPEATFGEPGVTFGLFGAWGGTVRLPKLIGEGNALEFALSGRVVDAAEALRMGLVSRVVDDPRTVAEDVAGNPADALAVVKRRVRDDGEPMVQERREAAAFADLVVAHGADLAASRE